MVRSTNQERNENIVREWMANPHTTADKLAAKLGFSRGVIIGVLDRAGYLDRRKTYTPNPRPKAPLPEVPVAAKEAPQALPIVCEEPEPVGVGIMDLKEHHCRWPVGRGRDGLATFCGDKKLPKISYCEGHFNRSRGGYSLRGA